MSQHYYINENRQDVRKIVEYTSSKEKATERIQELLAESKHSMSLLTFSVVAYDDETQASVTNRRILGIFHKQQWGGERGDDLISCGTTSFDATDAILLMTYQSLMKMEDNEDSSDEIGHHHVDWDGPCYVDIVDSVCAYFGVDDIKDITPEHFAFVQLAINPQGMKEVEVVISFVIKAFAAADTDTKGFIDNLKYSFVSDTPGFVVTNSVLDNYVVMAPGCDPDRNRSDDIAPATQRAKNTP